LTHALDIFFGFLGDQLSEAQKAAATANEKSRKRTEELIQVSSLNSVETIFFLSKNDFFPYGFHRLVTN
jgi:hypothetical protein